MTSISCKDKVTPGRWKDTVYLIEAIGSCHNVIPAGDEPQDSPTLIGNLIERLGDALERIGVRRSGATCRLALDDKVGAPAHDFNHLPFFGRVLHPRPIILSVHRVSRRADSGGGLGTRVFPIADHHPPPALSFFPTAP